MKLPQEIKQRYIKRRLEDIQLMKLSMDQGDFTQAVRVGHQVKGNAVTFEVPQIEWLGVAIETAAKSRDGKRLKSLIQKMELTIKEINCESSETSHD